ncbi:hypothetical protein [Chitinophaga defluvii]|uniref:YD repeat-containing protein n=1 Tax=Chitinophaga defluvii TaxID=3163343 RepID=A0ABV2TA77_9BACT
MPKQFSLVLIAVLLVAACRKSNTPPPPDNIIRPDSVFAMYLLPDMRTASLFSTIGTAYFTYNGNQIIKRAGGALPIAGTGYPIIATKQVFDTLLYDNNKITIITKARIDGITISPAEKVILLENGKMKQKILYSNNPDRPSNDTSFYFYGPDNRVAKVERYYGLGKELRLFTFNDKGNLQEVISTFYDRHSTAVNITVTENFSDYDNAVNTLKNYWMWSDFYYRSLSNNNFAKYSFTQVNADNTQHSNGTSNMTLHYDSNGWVDFSK